MLPTSTMQNGNSSPPPERGRHRRPSAAVLYRKHADAGRRLWSETSREGVKVSARFNRTIEKTKRAKRLRRDETFVERRLWSRLRSAQIDGHSFRRQHPAGPYDLDFYRPTLRLAIELDGGQHDHDVHNARDRHRDAWLRARGVTVLRFWNSDVAGNLQGVLEVISAAAEEIRQAGMTPTRRWRADLPLSGGGEKEPRS